MIRSLRKGRQSVYLQHKLTGHSIGAENFECDLDGKKAVFRLSLNPVDDNQRADEDYLHSTQLLSLVVDDSMVIDGLSRYLELQANHCTSLELQVLSRGKTLAFTVIANVEQVQSARRLCLTVAATAI